MPLESLLHNYNQCVISNETVTFHSCMNRLQWKYSLVGHYHGGIFSDFNCGSAKPSFMLGHGYIHINNGYLSISSFPSTSVNKKDPRLLSIKTTVLWLHVHHYHTRYSTDNLHLVNAFSSEHKITATLHPTPCNAITHATKQPLATSFTPDMLDHTHDL